jgi:hypothetical protein
MPSLIGKGGAIMDENLLRFLMMALFIAGALAIAAVAGELSYYSFSDPFEHYYPSLEFSNVTELMERMPLQLYVSVSGTVSHIDEDFISESGNEYQQFYVSDGNMEVKVFCSKNGGSVPVREGDRVFITGKFQKYYDTVEIYSDCPDINILRE